MRKLYIIKLSEFSILNSLNEALISLNHLSYFRFLSPTLIKILIIGKNGQSLTKEPQIDQIFAKTLNASSNIVSGEVEAK